MSFELLRGPDGYEADLVLVIAPYFDPDFARKMAAILTPRKIYYLVDDGSRNEEIDDLRKALPKKTEVKIALGGAAGLVHLKGIYIESVLSGGQRQRRHRRFLFGSANATMAAFGRRNAELIANVDLSRAGDADLLDYLERVAAAIKVGEGDIEGGSVGPLSHSPTLHLPSFTVSDPGPPPGFDAWLQRGRLAARFRDAQGFLIASVRLKATLPADLLTNTFTAHRLIDQSERNTVRYPYIGDVEPVETEQSAAHQWNSRFGIWSHLGNWISDTCHKEHWKEMISKSTGDRKSKIAAMLKNGDDFAWQTERREELLRALEGVWRELTDSRLAEPRDYLEGDEGGLARSHYEERFDRKFQADLLLAKDEDFEKRYVSGYDFPKVPKFRQDQEAWNSFAQSVCTSVAVEAAKSGSISLLTKSIRSAVEAAGGRLIEISDKEILGWLRENWDNWIEINSEEITVGEHITQYWKVPSSR